MVLETPPECGNENNINRQPDSLEYSSPQKFNLLLCLFGNDVRLMTFFVVVGPLFTFLFSIITQNDSFFFVSYAELGLLAGPLWVFACFGNYGK